MSRKLTDSGRGSTSEMEARAAASTGSSSSSLPVHFSLPPSVARAWFASPIQPGVSLVGADLRPQMMVQNVRASTFPHLQQQVQASLALSMGRQAWSSISDLESLHQWRCGATAPKLKLVQPVKESGQERRGEAAQATRDAQGKQEASVPVQAIQAPPETMTEVFLGKLWSGSLFSSSSSTPASPTSKRFLSTERWVVERCDGVKVYRVQYFNHADHFYAQVAPTDLSGLIGAAYLRFTRLLAPPSQ